MPPAAATQPISAVHHPHIFNEASRKYSYLEFRLRDALRPEWERKGRGALTQMTAGAQITRQTVEQHFGISEWTAKQDLGELYDLGMLELDRSRHPGWYRLK